MPSMGLPSPREKIPNKWRHEQGLERKAEQRDKSLQKDIALTRRTFVGKVMSLLFNILSRLVITFLLRSKRLLISWLYLS